MGFGKSFLLSLVAFVGLNFIFAILYFAIDPDSGGFDSLMTTIEEAPLMIIYYLFGSIASVPSTNMIGAIIQPLIYEDTSFLLLGLGYLAAPIIAGILAGKFAESKFQSLAGWLLTAVLSTGAIIIGVFLSNTMETTISVLYILTDFEDILIYLIISCVINIIFYSFFALLISKTEYY